MPRLSHRAPIFEDELADETIDLGTQQFLRNLDVVTILDQRTKRRIAMEPENLRDFVFRISRARIGFLLRHNQHVRDPKAARGEARDLDYAIVQRAASCL